MASRDLSLSLQSRKAPWTPSQSRSLPYSIGQRSENDNNANVAYSHLDGRIENTYAKHSAAMTAKSLYDSYIRAIRWASDRVGTSGVIGFVTNAGFLEATTADGLRKCLAEEFSSIHVFHLRGNQRTAGELSRREGGKIFGSGSRAPIAITMMVKNPAATENGQIRFHDIGDYLSREEKLEKIANFRSVQGITDAQGWQIIVPDAHGDWLKQRDNSFSRLIVMGDKKGDAVKLFENFSQGMLTARDAWTYNFSRRAVAENMERLINFYNGEVDRFSAAHIGLERKAKEVRVSEFIDADPSRISWSSSLLPSLVREEKGTFSSAKLTKSAYRPFSHQWLYYDGMFNHRISQLPYSHQHFS